jgi:hypothetical protein
MCKGIKTTAIAYKGGCWFSESGSELAESQIDADTHKM